jgi:hypothetical protein
MNTLIGIHSIAPFFKGKRRTTKDRIKQLGIEEYSYQAYEKMFLRPREKHHYIVKKENGWIEIKHPWNKALVLRHLTGEQTIGLFPAVQIDYLMFDIDRHNEEGLDELRSRIDKVTNSIEGEPLIYQSSFSGGIRLCYFLEKSVSRKALYSACKEFLRYREVFVKPGEIEILATRKGDRLPFGAGSYLIDPFTLEPIYHLTLNETISIADRVFEHQKIKIPFNIPSVDEKLISYSVGKSGFNQTVNQLYEEGLYPGITTNRALLMLNWDLQVRNGYPKEEAERFLQSWILKKHNGLSDRFNAGKVDNIFKQIKRIVQGTDPNKAQYSGSKWARRKKRLSLRDVRKITLFTENPKLRLALFSLLEYCLCFRKKVSVKVRKRTPISNLYVSENGDVTYRSGFDNNFYCELSKKTFQHLLGFDKAYPHITRQKIEDLGILSLKKDAHPDSNHCREYWIHFQFDEDDPIKVISLDEGLLKLKQLSTRKDKC